MTNLSEKKHWNTIHKNKSISFLNIFSFFEWIQNYEFFKICSNNINNTYNSVFEVWCAPWNYLIKFNKKFNLNINWIEYSEEWIIITKNNFKINNIKSNIIHWDFFDNDFLKNNYEKYDIVYSIWFIEHFDDPSITIDNHFKITKKWWLVVISIPNLSYLNKCLSPKKILNIHNLEIMNLIKLKQYFLKYNIIELKYSWWLFNFWLFYYKNPILEKIRFLLFIIQRLIFDPIFILLFKLWIDLSNKYTSPQILIICKK